MEIRSEAKSTVVLKVGSAYSPDIGWRVVWQRIGMGLSFKEIATRLQIGVGTAHCLYMRYDATGDVAVLYTRIQLSTCMRFVLTFLTQQVCCS